jgi:hypothetical protein
MSHRTSQPHIPAIEAYLPYADLRAKEEERAPRSSYHRAEQNELALRAVERARTWTALQDRIVNAARAFAGAWREGPAEPAACSRGH